MYKIISVCNNANDNDEESRRYRLGHVFHFEDHNIAYAFADNLRALKEEALDIAESYNLTTRQLFRRQTKWYNDCQNFIEEFGEAYMTADLRFNYNYIRQEKLFKPKVNFAPSAGHDVVAEDEELYSRMHERVLFEVIDVDYVSF